MDNDIKNLDTKNGQSLKTIYLNRLENIKKLLIQAITKGQDTTFLNKLKERIEKQIKLLKDEFEETSDNIIDEGQRIASENQKKSFEVLKLPLIASVLLDTGSKSVLKQNTRKALRLVTENIDKKVKHFVNTDFRDKEKVIQKFKNLTDTKIPPSRINDEYAKSLQEIIERDLKKKDIFKVAYKNKDGKTVRNVTVETYSEMLARTISANSYREEVKDIVLDQFKGVGDLVEVVGDPECRCDVCAKYLGAILSLTGKSKGFVTVDEAKEEGLFHPNCRHYFTVTENVLDVYNSNIIKVDSDFLGKNETEIRSNAQHYYKENLQGKSFTNPNLGDILFSNKGFKKLKSSSADVEKLKTVPNLPEIIEKGTYQGSEDIEHQRKDGILKFHRINTNVLINGKVQNMSVLVGETRDNLIFYNINTKTHKSSIQGTSR